MPMIADVIADQQRVHAAINNADIAHLRSWLGQIEDILANGFDDDVTDQARRNDQLLLQHFRHRFADR